MSYAQVDWSASANWAGVGAMSRVTPPSGTTNPASSSLRRWAEKALARSLSTSAGSLSGRISEIHRVIWIDAPHGSIDIRLAVLRGYDEYSRPNWDGMDAEPLSPSTLGLTKTLLKLVPWFVTAPDAAPGADGSIGLEWWVEGRQGMSKIFIDITADLKILCYWEHADGTFEERHFDGLTPAAAHYLESTFTSLFSPRRWVS